MALDDPRPCPTFTAGAGLPDPAAAVAAVLDRPDRELDCLEAKLAFDSIVEPSRDAETVRADVERLAGEAWRMAGPRACEAARMTALRRVLHESGAWNGHRPFAYDQSDPDGRRIRNKLLHHYLATHLGQCVSMPILFLILGERLGLDLALASAPCHVFLRHRLEDGRVANIEATSGGHPIRPEWLRQNFPMSDRALRSGLYMRSLSRREGVALMAHVVLEWLRAEQRYEELIAAADVILRHQPRDAVAMVMQGSASGALLEVLRGGQPLPFLVPAHLRLRDLRLLERHDSLIAAAEALGWEAEPRPHANLERN